MRANTQHVSNNPEITIVGTEKPKCRKCQSNKDPKVPGKSRCSATGREQLKLKIEIQWRVTIFPEECEPQRPGCATPKTLMKRR